MPDRIVREGILDSEAVNALSFGAEVFYRRLLSCADDFGRFTANPTLLRARLFALKLDSVSPQAIREWRSECVRYGLIRLYEVAGKEFLEVTKFNQRLRAKHSKWPVPPTTGTENKREKSESAVACQQCADICPPEANSEANSESDSETESEANSETVAAPRAAPVEPPPAERKPNALKPVPRFEPKPKTRPAEAPPNGAGGIHDGPFERFCEHFRGAVEDTAWRVFGTCCNTPELLAAVEENTPLWMQTRRYSDGMFGAIKFLQSGVWKKPPRDDILPDRGGGGRRKSAIEARIDDA